ncbi:MAG: hypothetical protein JO344_16485, partial [Planctomycetaceae bacterium]|nr:hypothetical protein [Planctomycetaceae bacterium]
MSRLRDLLVLIGVACAVSGSSFVLGQAQDVAVPPPRAVVPPRPAEKKKVEPAKADAAAALDAQAAQYVQQFRPMFRAEYYFIRNT